MTTVDRAKPVPPKLMVLSIREFEVLFYMSHGAANKTIGRRLELSEDTVKTHCRRLFRKLGAADRGHAVRRGFELGLLRNTTEEAAMPFERPSHAAMRGDRERLPVVDWQVLERVRIAANRQPRPISVTHIGACFAAESCPCRTGSTWSWPAGQVFADPVPMPEVSR